MSPSSRRSSAPESWGCRPPRCRWTGYTSSPRPVDHHRLPHTHCREATRVRNPITTGFVDDRTGILFSSDCFGALLPAVSESAADLDSDTLRGGQVRLATIDSPWIHQVDRDRFVSPDQADLEAMMAAMGAQLA